MALNEVERSYVDKRLAKIAKLLAGDSTAKCDLELAKTTEHHQKGDIYRAEIHIVAVGKNLYAANEQSDIFSAIDGVRDEILRELKAQKTKRTSYIRRGGAKIKAMIRGLWKSNDQSAE